MVAGLRAAFDAGRLQFHGSQQPLADLARFAELCRTLRAKEWVVYSKRPFAGPAQVLKYLSRYTHSVAISNHRIVAFDGDAVTFRYRDYARGSRSRTMTLRGVEFLRRFLMHVLPKNFVRIRHYGFLANRARKEKLPACRRLIAQQLGATLASAIASDEAPPAEDRRRCRHCGNGTMRRLYPFDPQPTWHFDPMQPMGRDTS